MYMTSSLPKKRLTTAARAVWAPFVISLFLLGGCDRKLAGGKADGPKIFSEVCARCHGPGGNPTACNIARLEVKPLTSEKVQKRLTDAEIRNQILNGSENKQMPSFQGALTEAQVVAIIEHVRTLGTKTK